MPSAPATTSPLFEEVTCYGCGCREGRAFIDAHDELTGSPGTFHFVTCDTCGLAYQNPRISIDHIRELYEGEDVARPNMDGGLLTEAFERAIHQLDAAKDRIVCRYVGLNASSAVLDVGCGAGTFLRRLRRRYGAAVTGVDFRNFSSCPALKGTEFHCGVFHEAALADRRFDVVTMWHFLEHDYDPMRSLRTAHRVLKTGGYLVIEVPRLDSVTFRMFRNRWPGLQAPQHTVLFDRAHLLQFVERAGLETVDYLPYGTFPAYFYLFTGTAFLVRKGRGLNLTRAVYPYLLGRVLTAPVLAFEKHLNLAMQTVVCRRTEDGGRRTETIT